MKIVTDSAADLSNEELEQLGIAQAPLFIQFPEGEISAADISADDFYNRLEAMRPAIPTTATPPSPGSPTKPRIGRKAIAASGFTPATCRPEKPSPRLRWW